MGLRCEEGDAAILHSAVKPDAIYLAAGPRTQYLAGPMPFGCDRSAITRAFKELQWDVKPLQPVSSLAGRGNMWSLLAVDAPPQPHFQMEHGEILVTKQKVDEKGPKVERAKPVASDATIQLCGTVSKVDPWHTEVGLDPWQSYQPREPAPQPTAAIKQFESNVEQSVLSKLPASMPADMPDRTQLLEAQVQQLAAQNQQIERHIKDTDQRQSGQIAALQTQMNQQSTQFHGALETQQQNLQAMFESQMAQIRGLLSKRPLEAGDAPMS